jgi:predicted DNA-binding transcriptional regulator AlpA
MECGMEKYLSPDQVVELIPGMTRANLAALRFTGKGPRYRKPSAKLVIYVESEVRDWIEGTARYGTATEAV